MTPPNPFHYRGWLIEEAKGIVFYWRAVGERKFTAESVEDAKFMIRDFYA